VAIVVVVVVVVVVVKGFLSIGVHVPPMPPFLL
jgi:hypothetical protein